MAASRAARCALQRVKWGSPSCVTGVADAQNTPRIVILSMFPVRVDALAIDIAAPRRRGEEIEYPGAQRLPAVVAGCRPPGQTCEDRCFSGLPAMPKA